MCRPVACLAVFMFAFIGGGEFLLADETPDSWYRHGQAALMRGLEQKINTRPARNIILFLGDGMGISTITAARILQGQQQGRSGEENSLAFEMLPYTALVKTYNTDQQVADSAGTMSAIMTGIKTRAGFISVNQEAMRGDCRSARGKQMMTLLELLEQAGYSTGIISTTRITHATPAASYAHTPERGWESDADMPPVAIGQGCKDIAQQFVDFPYGDGMDVVLGGGRSKFLPVQSSDPEYPVLLTGEREDGQNLIETWQRRYPKGEYVWNAEQFESVDVHRVEKLLGLFEPGHMRYQVDRPNDAAGEPGLAEMVARSLTILQRNSRGYFLLVEAGRIDHGHHVANAHLALHDTIALSDAVKQALSMVDPDNTLIIVTADHSHVFTIAGYPLRGNPILGKVKPNWPASGGPWPLYALADDGLPYTTLGYMNGGRRLTTEHAHVCKPPYCRVEPHRRDLTSTDTTARSYVHESLIPLSSETHGGEDVAVFASGPWAHLLTGVHEQNYLYHVMRHALQLKE